MIACVGSLTPLVEAGAAKKNALLQIDTIAPIYALLVLFRHERGRSARLEGDVIEHAVQLQSQKRRLRDVIAHRALILSPSFLSSYPFAEARSIQKMFIDQLKEDAIKC